MPHAGLGGKMHDMRKPAVAEQGRHAVAIVQVEFLEMERVEAGELGEPRLFQRGS